MRFIDELDMRSLIEVVSLYWNKSRMHRFENMANQMAGGMKPCVSNAAGLVDDQPGRNIIFDGLKMCLWYKVLNGAVESSHKNYGNFLSRDENIPAIRRLPSPLADKKLFDPALYSPLFLRALYQ